MKKLIMMAATLIMCFAFSLSVMAAPSPEDEYYNTSMIESLQNRLMWIRKPRLMMMNSTRMKNQLRRKQQRHQHHQHQQHLHHQRLVIRERQLH